MKVVLVLFSIYFCGFQAFEFSQYEVENFNKYKDFCYKESILNDADIVNFFMEGNVTDNIKCLLRCIYVQSGIMSDNGTLNLEQVKKAFPEEWEWDDEDKESIMEICKDLEETGDCKYAYDIHNCYFDDSESEEDDCEENALSDCDDSDSNSDSSGSDSSTNSNESDNSSD